MLPPAVLNHELLPVVNGPRISAVPATALGLGVLQQAHWAVPERILGVLPYIYISHTRLAAFLLPKFYSTVRLCVQSRRQLHP